MTYEIPGANNEFFRTWTAAYFEARRGVHVPLSFIDINDGYLSDATLFSQIMYWHEPSPDTGKTRLRVKHDGKLWLAKNHADWYAECRIKACTARVCLERIKARGLIDYELHGFNGNQTPFIRINEDGFEKAMRKWINENVANPSLTGAVASDEDSQDGSDTPLLENNSPPVKNSQPPCENLTAPLLENNSPNTETTTQTTTESTSLPTLETKRPLDAPPGPLLRGQQPPPPRTHRARKRVEVSAPKPLHEERQTGLAGYIATVARAKGLTDNQLEEINRVIEMHDPKNPAKLITFGNPAELWENDSLFPIWVQERIDYVRKGGRSMSRTHAINAIQSGMVMSSKYGWMQWRENPLNIQKAPKTSRHKEQRVGDGLLAKPESDLSLGELRALDEKRRQERMAAMPPQPEGEKIDILAELGIPDPRKTPLR